MTEENEDIPSYPSTKVTKDSAEPKKEIPRYNSTEIEKKSKDQD